MFSEFSMKLDVDLNVSWYQISVSTKNHQLELSWWQFLLHLSLTLCWFVCFLVFRIANWSFSSKNRCIAFAVCMLYVKIPIRSRILCTQLIVFLFSPLKAFSFCFYIESLFVVFKNTVLLSFTCFICPFYLPAALLSRIFLYIFLALSLLFRTWYYFRKEI